MKRIIGFLGRLSAGALGGIAAMLILGIGVAMAVNFPGSLNNWQEGQPFTHEDANAIEAKIGADNSTVSSSLDYITKNTSSPLGKIRSIATTTGNLIVGCGTNWAAFTIGTDGKILTASSTATCGIAWQDAATGISSLNGLTGSTQTFATSGPALSISSSGTTHTFSLPTSTASQTGVLSSTDWTTFNSKVGTSLALTAGAGLTGGGDLSADRTFAVGAGTNIVVNADDVAVTSTPSFTSVTIPSITNSFLATDSNGLIIATSTPESGGTPGGSDTHVQFNNGGSFGGESVFTYSSTSKTLTLGNATSSEIIRQAFFPGSASSTSFSAAGATTTFVVPDGVYSITMTVIGSAGEDTSLANGGDGGVATGTLTVSPGETLYVMAASGATPGGGSGAGLYGGDGGGMSWVSRSPTFSTSSVIIVGAGGGGSASKNDCPGSQRAGGAAGGLTGTAGTGPAGGGGGGTQSAGGAAGGNGGAGAAGQGGSGGSGSNQGGGAGGGGYYGGGGGGGASNCDGASGGGGSSFISSILQNATTTGGGNTSPTGSVTFTYSILSSAPQGKPALAVGGHIVAGGGAVGVSSCGTSPSVSGNDFAGKVTLGTGTVNSCQVDFNESYPSAPVCVANFSSQTSSSTVINVASATSSLVMNFSASSPSRSVNYICVGM